MLVTWTNLTGPRRSINAMRNPHNMHYRYRGKPVMRAKVWGSLLGIATVGMLMLGPVPMASAFFPPGAFDPPPSPPTSPPSPPPQFHRRRSSLRRRRRRLRHRRMRRLRRRRISLRLHRLMCHRPARP